MVDQGSPGLLRSPCQLGAKSSGAGSVDVDLVVVEEQHLRRVDPEVVHRMFVDRGVGLDDTDAERQVLTVERALEHVVIGLGVPVQLVGVAEDGGRAAGAGLGEQSFCALEEPEREPAETLDQLDGFAVDPELAYEGVGELVDGGPTALEDTHCVGADPALPELLVRKLEAGQDLPERFEPHDDTADVEDDGGDGGMFHGRRP